MNKIVSLFLLSLFAVQVSYAQLIELNKTGGHYVFDMTLNEKAVARVLLETGFNVSIVDSTFFFDNIDVFNFELEPSNAKIGVHTGGSRVILEGNVSLKVNDSFEYRGKMVISPDFFAGKDYNAIIPMQQVYNQKDNGSSILMLDLANEKMNFLTREELGAINYRKRYKMTSAHRGMPIINTDMVFHYGDKKVELSGEYVLDLGNGSVLFMNMRNEIAKKAIKGSDFVKIHEVKDNNTGAIIAEAICPDKGYIAGEMFEYPSIGLTEALTSFTELGLIGLKYFKTKIVVFDFVDGYFYVL